jgi:hypothetical protein
MRPAEVAVYGFAAIAAIIAVLVGVLSQLRKSRWRTEIHLGISLAFCVLALFMIRNDWRQGVVTLAFFGGCALTFLGVILRKRRERRFHANLVHVVGGVDIPFDRRRFVAVAVGLAALGSIMFAVGTGYPWLFRILGLILAFCGITLLAGLLLGLVGRRFIRFERRGIVFGERTYSFCVRWESIRGIQAFEYHHNPLVGLDLADPLVVEVTPASKHEVFLKSVGRNRGWMGADIVIATQSFALEVPPLMAALRRYLDEPETREELENPEPTAAGSRALPVSVHGEDR